MGQPSYLDDIERYEELKQDLRKLVDEMRKEERNTWTTPQRQGYGEASGDWADELEKLIGGE